MIVNCNERGKSMAHKNKLKNPPIVEVVVEIRWGEKVPNLNVDSRYRFLLGRLFEKLSDKYPEIEYLPAAQVPEQMIRQVVQYRFRKGKDEWPLIQIGPGVFTINDTENYEWINFRKNCENAIKALYASSPEPEDLKINEIILRYINAININYNESNIIDFLREQMKISLSFPDMLFNSQTIANLPSSLECTSSFKCQKPNGVVTLKVSTGLKNNEPALIFELLLSQNENVPIMPDGFKPWLDSAHSILEDWFFKIISGDLERRFNE